MSSDIETSRLKTTGLYPTRQNMSHDWSLVYKNIIKAIWGQLDTF
jgi:hypothetical protein